MDGLSISPGAGNSQADHGERRGNCFLLKVGRSKGPRPVDKEFGASMSSNCFHPRFLYAALLLAFSAALSAETVAQSRQNATNAVEPAVDASSTPPRARSAVEDDYVIGPGDTLEIFVWRNPELSTRIPVRPDGKISTPLVEDITAVGKTTSQLARDMEAILAKYVRSPNVNVIVAQAVSASSQVSIVGQAANPSSIPYRQGLRVLDAIIAVGGMSEFAAGNRAKLVRSRPNGEREEIRIRLKNLMEKGDLSQNLPLQPGDVIVIPESAF